MANNKLKRCIKFSAGPSRLPEEIWLCPVCDKECDSQHTFTVHIRQHNPTDHSHTCSICGKTLSSASSLDRHMLIHSGERPFKCKICNMTFTTNGNMHRHMRTHGTESNENAAPNDVKSGIKRNNNNSNDNGNNNDNDNANANVNVIDNDNDNDNIQNASIGFHDLTFTDFSSHKYPLIAQSFCESNIRKSSSPFHNFQCTNCPKAFPCAAALSLHQQKAHHSILSADHSSLKSEPNANQTKSSTTFSSTFCHFCQIQFGSSVEYLTHAAKHRYESFLSVVNGVNLTSNPNLPIHFPKAIVTNPTVTSDKLPSVENSVGDNNNICNDDGDEDVKDDSNNHSSQSLNIDNEKEQFLAMLQLHKKNLNNSLVKVQSIDGSTPFKDLESNFDNTTYYNNAEPSIKRLKKISISNSSKTTSKVNSKTSNGKSDGQSIPKTKEPKKQPKLELADNNYTNSKDSLLKNMTSSSSLLSSANSTSLDNNKPSFKRRKLSPSTSPSSARSPSRASVNLPLQDTDKMNGDNSNSPSVGGTSTSSHSEDGEKEMEIDLSENNSSGTSGSMEKENSEEMDTGEPVPPNNSETNANETQQNYRCDICSLEFKTFNALKRHNRGHSKSGHNYVCNMCSYTSLDKSTLVRHLRTHNGERPFQCAICKYAFTTKSNCERHVRKRHKKLSKPEIKSAMVFNAGLSTSSSTSASSQVTVQNVTRHNSLPNISGPEWPGPNDTLCRFCNQDLKSNKTLRRHIKTLHNALSQKPYSCTLCKMGFSTKNNCIRHVIRLHPEMKDDIKSVVLVNGVSIPSQCGSDDISESEGATHVGEAPVGGINSVIGTVSRRKSNTGKSASSTILQNQDKTFLENSNPPTSSLPIPNASGHEDAVDSITLAWQFHSSLAALCQIISPISPIAGNTTNTTTSSFSGLPGTVQNQSVSVNGDYDGEESNGEYQPLDLAKATETEKEPNPSKQTIRNQTIPVRLFSAHGEPQPLDLAAHALDLSVKTTPPPSKLQPTQSNLNQCLVELNKCSEPIRTAASSLLALQSFIPASK